MEIDIVLTFETQASTLHCNLDNDEIQPSLSHVMLYDIETRFTL